MHDMRHRTPATRPTLHRPARRRSTWAALITAAATIAAAAPSPAWSRGDLSVTIDAEDSDRLDSCDQVKIRFGLVGGGRHETARSDTRFTVPRSEAATLRATLLESGGVHVQPWEGSDYEVEVCKAAAGKSMESARRALDGVVVEHAGGRITASGPEEAQWVVFLIVRVPKNPSIELTTRNGQISVRDVTGTIVARSTNGPIALKNCAGDLRAMAENGPIATSGSRGKARLSTRNGPIAVELTGTSWEGAGLTAETENGPLALSIGSDFTTGVSVVQRGNSPVVCQGAACMSARRVRREGHRSLVFGDTDPIIKLSTVNGPIAISPLDGEDEGELL